MGVEGEWGGPNWGRVGGVSGRDGVRLGKGVGWALGPWEGVGEVGWVGWGKRDRVGLGKGVGWALGALGSPGGTLSWSYLARVDEW